MPMVLSIKLTWEYGSGLIDVTLYIQLVGKLLYLNNTRPDISYSVQQLSQFLDAHTRLHLQVTHRELRYLKATPE